MASAEQLDDNFVTKLSTAIASGIAQTAGPKKVTQGQYEPKTPWQAKKREAHKLVATCYQNGYRIPERRLTNVEIDGLNAIKRPGRYINRMVEVALWEDGGKLHLDIR